MATADVLAYLAGLMLVVWGVAHVAATRAVLSKMLAQRRAAGYYAKSTGELPPPLRKDADGKLLSRS